MIEAGKNHILLTYQSTKTKLICHSKFNVS